ACCVWATLLKPDVARSGKGNSPVPCTAWADQKWSTIPRSYLGVIYLFENWLRPAIDSGELEPVLQPWWQTFSGPYLYYSGRRLVPPPLRAFIDFIQSTKDAVASFPDR
ncbi:MAG: hypothetical protein ACR5LH_05750, partial [Sodalis sp. (in: enterobacteria)]